MQAVAEFGGATDLIVQQSKTAYQLVNDTVYREQVAHLVAGGNPDAFKRDAIKPYITGEDLADRIKLLDALEAYATKLSNLTTKPMPDVDTESAALAASLESLKNNDRLKRSLRETKTITNEDMDGLSAGLDAVIKLFANHKIHKELPAILKSADPGVESISKILAKEIGDIPNSAKPAGLRERLWRVYDELIIDQQNMARHDQSLSDKRLDLAKLPELVSEQRTADETLAKTQKALERLATAHQGLLKVQSNPTGFRAAVTSVIAEAKDIKTFYDKLPSK